MSTADIAILCLIALPMIVGVFYGFLNIVFSLLSWAISLGIATKFASYFTPLLENYVDTYAFQMVLSFIGLFILSLLIMSGISFFIIKLLGKTGLTAADRIFGLFSGMGLGILIVSIIVFMAGFTPITEETWWQGSKLVKPFERISLWASNYLPESISERPSYEQAEEDE